MMISAALVVLAEAAALAAPVRHYLRTNSDGTEAERVVVYAPEPGRVEVFKGRSRCSDAAYVIGQLDPVTGQAGELVGGRLTRELNQRPTAWLSRTADGRLVGRLGRPGAEPVFSVDVGRRWVLYDFDFSDLIAHPPAEIFQRESFAFELPLVLTGDPPSFTNRGELRLAFVGEEPLHGVPTLRYRAWGPALDGGEGAFWFDARDGRLVEARLPLANHAEYRDFQLTLVKTEDGEAAWRSTLAEHWTDCPGS
jgi:hypothetical protein